VNQDLAKARYERKRNAATLRREIRVTVKSLQGLAQALSQTKADVWSIALQIEEKSIELKLLQKALNAVLNRADEVEILKRASKAPMPEPVRVILCDCGHVAHLGTCDVQVEWTAGFGVVKEPCGCTK